MATAKAFIGNGKSTQYNDVRVTLRMEDAHRHIWTGSDGQQWLTFIVAPKQNPDTKGRTHNVFVITSEPAPAAPAASIPENHFPDPMEVAEPHGDVPEGVTVTIDGRKLRKISKKEAAAIRAKKAQA